MLEARRLWRQRPTSEAVVAELEHDLGLGHLSARLLAMRGLSDAAAVRRFLDRRLTDLRPPEDLRDMDVAAKRLASAIERRERILIHGDYDVDGSTAATLLLQFCRCCSHDAQVWIPHRLNDGYGLGEGSLEAVREYQAQLMVTVDCGTCDNGYAARIEAETGCAVIVTDHHLPGTELPRCTAVVNPNRGNCPSLDKHLAGVGVAWKLAWATAKVLSGSERVSDRLRQFLIDALGLVAIGTVADCASLQGENRILVHHGLKALGHTTNHGLRALLVQARCSAEPAADEIGWRIGPLLNASGRLSSAMRNVELLTATDAEQAGSLLASIVAENDERRRLSQILTDDLIAEIDGHDHYRERATLVFAGDGWHPGVVGIVASRLTERYGKPSCVIALDEGQGKGSLRTVPEIDLSAAIEACQHLIERGGGHAAAAGLSIRPDQVAAFTEAFEAWVRGRHPATPELPRIEHDGLASIAELDAEFFATYEAMAPFGNGNPQPVLHLPSVSFAGRLELFGRNGEHVRGAITDAGGGGPRQFLAWKAGPTYQDLASPGCCFDLLVRPEVNRWRDRREPRLVLVDGRSR